MKYIKKLFGGIGLSWLKLLIFAVVSGVYTGGVLIVLPLADTSFTDIGASFEWWILFAIIIISNCQKPLEAAAKTFVFFLISQPLVYLVQVPFSWLHWGLFGYYPTWFLWTLLTFPMAFVGWFVKKGKWYSLLILSPMLILLAVTGMSYLHETLYLFPRHLLTVIFCIVQIFLLVFAFFDDKKLRIAGCAVGAAFIAVFFFTNVYHKPYVITNISGFEIDPDTKYTVSVADENILKVVSDDFGDPNAMQAEFYSIGSTEMTLTDEKGNVLVYEAALGKNYKVTFELKEKKQ